jgi:hypothetical protein
MFVRLMGFSSPYGNGSKDINSEIGSFWRDDGVHLCSPDLG